MAVPAVQTEPYFKQKQSPDIKEYPVIKCAYSIITYDRLVGVSDFKKIWFRAANSTPEVHFLLS